MSTERSPSPGLLRIFLPLLCAALLASCGGGGGGGGESCGSGTTITVSGNITFDRVPFKTTVNTGLDFVNAVKAPARDVVVELIQSSNGGVRQTAITDASGAYSLQGPANCSMFVRAKAQMLKSGAAPTWNFRVLNNTNGDALYTLDGAAFTASSNVTRDLHAASGWGGSGYTDTRAAAPFAILDTVYKVKALVLSAKPDAAFPGLDLYWSVNNRAADPFCPDNGNIGTSLYTTFPAEEPNDKCSTPTPGKDGIYLLGSFSGGDTDEFDEHVIAHEAGHYFEDKFSRSDSIGGEHGRGDKLDMRVAFGEGWGSAFGAMVLNNPEYRDSYAGAGADSAFNMESGAVTNPGWYSEFSIQKYLWDLFDSANESGDTVPLGFVPLYNVMTGAESTTTALTSLFTFTRALKANNAAQVSGIDTLLAQHGINPITDDFGSSELVLPGGGTNVLPLYTDISSGTPVMICGSTAYGGSNAGEYNKISNRRFLKFQSAATRTINISTSVQSGAVGADPDIVVWRQGTPVAVGDEVGNESFAVPVQANATYIIEVYDFQHIDSNANTGVGATCINVSIAG